MPIYEYLAEQCQQTPPCSRKKEYIQGMSEPALASCRECGAAIRRVLSSFAARSGAAGASVPDPTPLNMTGIPAPSAMPGSEGGGCGHDH
jgi:putative FmdB family regulatory protein